LKSSKLNIILS